MTDAQKNFTSMTNEEIMSELKKADRLHLELKRLKSQLKLYVECENLILWTKEKVELQGEEAIRYLKKRLVALIKELIGETP